MATGSPPPREGWRGGVIETGDAIETTIARRSWSRGVRDIVRALRGHADRGRRRGRPRLHRGHPPGLVEGAFAAPDHEGGHAVADEGPPPTPPPHPPLDPHQHPHSPHSHHPPRPP